jgi:release factor glutamine methyltransferase
MNLLQTATKQLMDAGIGTARLDVLVLLEDITGKDRTHLLAHPEMKLTSEQQKQLQKLLDRRCKHEPLAYIRGKTEFYGREFTLTADVLEPRPESETMIDLLKTLELADTPYIADIGSGSGALGITAKLELPDSHVDLIELDDKALVVSQLNTKKLDVNVQCIKSNLLLNVNDTKYDVILANLPYVPDDYQINEAASMEPHVAIFGGPDGLDLYRTMFEQLVQHTNSPAFVLTESLPFQHAELLSIAAAQKFTHIAEQDFIQIFTHK